MQSTNSPIPVYLPTLNGNNNEAATSSTSFASTSKRPSSQDLSFEYSRQQQQEQQQEQTQAPSSPQRYSLTPSNHQPTKTPLQRRRVLQKLTAFLPSTLAQRLYLVVHIVESLVDISIEAAILGRFEYENNVISGIVKGPPPPSGTTQAVSSQAEKSVLPVYLGIFVLAHIFQLILVVDALAAKNTIQLIGLLIFQILFLLYAIIQIQEIRQAFGNADQTVSVLVDVIPIMISATFVAQAGLTWYLFKEFGWNVYKKIGADRAVKKMYLKYQVYICFLKFDYFFFIAFSLQFVLLVLNQSDVEKWLTTAAAPVTLVMLILAGYAVKYEIRWLMSVVVAACVAGGVYFSYKLIRIYQGKLGDYQLVFKSLTTFSAMSLLLLIGTLVYSVFCLRNFDRGLKQAISKQRKPTSKAEMMDGEGDGMSYSLGHPHPSRLSID